MEDFGFLILFITFLIMAIGIFAASIIKLPNKEEADSDNKKETQADKSIGAVDNDSMKSNANTNNENQDLNGEAELYEKMLNATQNQIQNETTIRNEPQKSVANGGNMKGRNVAIAILVSVFIIVILLFIFDDHGEITASIFYISFMVALTGVPLAIAFFFIGYKIADSKAKRSISHKIDANIAEGIRMQIIKIDSLVYELEKKRFV